MSRFSWGSQTNSWNTLLFHSHSHSSDFLTLDLIWFIRAMSAIYSFLVTSYFLSQHWKPLSIPLLIAFSSAEHAIQISKFVIDHLWIQEIYFFTIESTFFLSFFVGEGGIKEFDFLSLPLCHTIGLLSQDPNNID